MNKNTTKKIFLVRHTSLAIENGVCYGRSDIDVSPTFDQEAEAITEKLGDLRQAKFFSSPLTRTKKLAAAIANKNDVTEIEYSDNIIEIDYGTWEMRRWDDIDPQQFGRFFKNIVDHAPAQGESFAEVVKRVQKFWQKLLALPNETIVVVTHGGVLKAFMSVVAKIEPMHASGFLFDYGGSICVEHIEGFNRILYVNR